MVTVAVCVRTTTLKVSSFCTVISGWTYHICIDFFRKWSCFKGITLKRFDFWMRLNSCTSRGRHSFQSTISILAIQWIEITTFLFWSGHRHEKYLLPDLNADRRNRRFKKKTGRVTEQTKLGRFFDPFVDRLKKEKNNHMRLWIRNKARLWFR